MADAQLDHIHIRDLELRCIIGIYEHEREARQDVKINVTLHADLRAPCNSDAIEDTVDYKSLKKRIVAMVEESSYFLVERLAQAVADICLADPRIRRVDVEVDKPGALRFARSVAVAITRERG